MDQKHLEKELASVADRTSDVRSLGNDLLAAWGFDLPARRPGVAYVDEAGNQVTSLDMACLLSQLVEWGSAINLPTYQALGARTVTEGQVVTSKENRHGKIAALVSNQDVFNFSLRIDDANVLTAHSVGAWRNFLVYHDGHWHEGFRSLTFLPTNREKELLAKIPSNGNTIIFEHFISPNRWPSFYGRHYLLAKALIGRLADQRKDLAKQIKTLQEELDITPPEYPRQETVGETEPKMVWRFHATVHGLAEMTGEYPVFPTSKEGLEDAQLLRSRLGTIQERLSFQVRATEWAFFQRVLAAVPANELLDWVAGKGPQVTVSKPAWVADAWTSYQQSKRHKPWCQISVHGLTLRWQPALKTIQVAV